MHRHVKGIFYQARIISLGVITRSRQLIQQKECGISFSGVTDGTIFPPCSNREGKSPLGAISSEDSNSDY